MNLPSLPSLPASVWIAGLFSFVVALVLILTNRWHGRFTMDELKGVQKMHAIPTPRVGGVAILSGALGAWVVANLDQGQIISSIIIAGMPAFVFGLAEDLTKRVGVILRLLATIASGVLGWWLTGVSLSKIDILFIDPLLSNAIISVAFTAFAVGGVANAVNIIDGFNGLAGGFVVIALIGISLIASMNGDMNLSLACMALAASVLGFWLVNWPWGKIFLGDGGSYFGGFALAWASVLLVERNQSVSAFVPVLISIHPITEVLFSIYRRRKNHSSPGAPDRLHLHSLVMRRVVLPRIKGGYGADTVIPKLVVNSVTGMLIMLMTIPAVIASLFLVHHVFYSAMACVIFSVGYVAIYARLVKFHWVSPMTFLRKKRT